MSSTTVSGQPAPTDTWQAALSMAINPTNNIPNLFSLIGSTPAFEPTYTSSPATWQLDVNGTPIIATLSSDLSSGGNTLTIEGSNFGTDPSALSVVAGGMPAPIATLATSTITVQIPEGALDTAVQVYAKDVASNALALSKTTTFTSVTLQPSIILYGASFTANVAVTTHTPALANGTVTCTVATQTLSGTLKPVTTTSTATLTFSGVPIGTQPVICSYAGATFYAGSPAPTVVETVLPATAPVSVALSGSPSTTTYGDLVALTVTVTPVSASSFTPSGSVTLSSGGRYWLWFP